VILATFKKEKNPKLGIEEKSRKEGHVLKFKTYRKNCEKWN